MWPCLPSLPEKKLKIFICTIVYIQSNFFISLTYHSNSHHFPCAVFTLPRYHQKELYTDAFPIIICQSFPALLFIHDSKWFQDSDSADGGNFM